jgi:hypothetical protein
MRWRSKGCCQQHIARYKFWVEYHVKSANVIETQRNEPPTKAKYLVEMGLSGSGWFSKKAFGVKG